MRQKKVYNLKCNIIRGRGPMNIDELFQFLITPAAQISIIMAVAEIVKQLEIMEPKYIPVFDLLFGMICGVLVYGIITEYGILKSAIIGAALGLAACGLFSGFKNVTS